MATCSVCRGEYGPGGRCSRCGSATSFRRENYGLKQFFSSFVLLVAFLGIIFVAASEWCIFPSNAAESPEKLFSILFLGVAIIGVIVVPFGVYEQLWSLRERQWAAEIFDLKYVRISWLMVDSLGIVFLTMIGSYALYMAWGNAGVDENITWWQKMIFGVVQIVQYSALSLIVSLYRLSGWLRDLREEMPQPIYTDMLKLKSVVRAEVLEMLEFCDKGGGIHPEQSVNYGVVLVVKQRNKKQFYMTFGLVGGRGRALARPEDIVQREQKKQWEVITDRWGRIKSLQPKHQVVVVRAS